MLDNIRDFEKAIRSHGLLEAFVAGDLYCPPCGGPRRVAITFLYEPRSRRALGLNLAGDVLEQLTPSLLLFVCLQCETKFIAVLYPGPDGPALAVLPSCRGGLTTPRTPPGVAFYLDQAHKAESVGAYSAAVAMFRGALEHLLFEQGHKTGMLNAKLTKLEADVQSRSAPKWALELDTAFLQVLKDLGNGSIHPNDGDVTKQAALDGDLLVRVKEVFLYLLFLVYEAPHQKAAALAALQAKAQILKK
jgi:hypothetical protein